MSTIEHFLDGAAIAALAAVNIPAIYLIWSNQRAAWWREQGMGYVTDSRLAGHYNKLDALEICRLTCRSQDPRDVPNDIAVPLSDVPFIMNQRLPLTSAFNLRAPF